MRLLAFGVLVVQLCLCTSAAPNRKLQQTTISAISGAGDTIYLCNFPYTIQASDTPVSVAASFTGVGWRALTDANPVKLAGVTATSSLATMAGQNIIIPNQVCSAGGIPARDNECPVVYFIQPEDTIPIILNKFSFSGVTQDQLEAENPMTLLNSLVPGTIIWIPNQPLYCGEGGGAPAPPIPDSDSTGPPASTPAATPAPPQTMGAMPVQTTAATPASPTPTDAPSSESGAMLIVSTPAPVEATPAPAMPQMTPAPTDAATPAPTDAPTPALETPAPTEAAPPPPDTPAPTEPPPVPEVTPAPATPAPTTPAVPAPSNGPKLCVTYEWQGPEPGDANCGDLTLLGTDCYMNWNVVPTCAGQEYLYTIRQVANPGPIDWGSVGVLQIYNEPNLEPGFLGDSDSTSDGGTACANYLQLIGNLPDRSAVTLLSPGVAMCVQAPDGSFYFDKCIVQHTTYLQQFFDAGCNDVVPVVSAHIYRCDFSDVVSYVAELHAAFPDKPIWLTEAGCDDPTRPEQDVLFLLQQYRDANLPGLARVYWKSTRVAANLIDVGTGGLTQFGLVFTRQLTVAGAEAAEEPNPADVVSAEAYYDFHHLTNYTDVGL